MAKTPRKCPWCGSGPQVRSRCGDCGRPIHNYTADGIDFLNRETKDEQQERLRRDEMCRLYRDADPPWVVRRDAVMVEVQCTNAPCCMQWMKDQIRDWQESEDYFKKLYAKPERMEHTKAKG